MDWQEAKSSAPCGVCNSPKSCRLQVSAGIWHCRHEHANRNLDGWRYLGESLGGTWSMYAPRSTADRVAGLGLGGLSRFDATATPNEPRPKVVTHKESTPDIRFDRLARHAHAKAIEDDRRQLWRCAEHFFPNQKSNRAALAQIVDELEDRLVGHLEYYAEDETSGSRGVCLDIWTFPEFDSDLTVIGVLMRFQNGAKFHMKGSKRGIYIPQGWQKKTGSIVMPEGGSDSVSAGAICPDALVIGRPNDASGGDLIEKFIVKNGLHLTGRQFAISADNDADGNGLAKGEKVAAALAKAIGVPVACEVVSATSKDSRTWLADRLAESPRSRPSNFEPQYLAAMFPPQLPCIFNQDVEEDPGPCPFPCGSHLVSKKDSGKCLDIIFGCGSKGCDPCWFGIRRRRDYNFSMHAYMAQMNDIPIYHVEIDPGEWDKVRKKIIRFTEVEDCTAIAVENDTCIRNVVAPHALEVGMAVTGTGVPDGTVIDYVDADVRAVFLSNKMTVTGDIKFSAVIYNRSKTHAVIKTRNGTIEKYHVFTAVPLRGMDDRVTTYQTAQEAIDIYKVVLRMADKTIRNSFSESMKWKRLRKPKCWEKKCPIAPNTQVLMNTYSDFGIDAKVIETAKLPHGTYWAAEYRRDGMATEAECDFEHRLRTGSVDVSSQVKSSLAMGLIWDGAGQMVVSSSVSTTLGEFDCFIGEFRSRTG